MRGYEPARHFWAVGSDDTRVYSSAAGDYVGIEDATYRAFLADGGIATRIANESELGDVLAPLALRPSATGVLDAYKDSQAGKLTIETVAKVTFNLHNRVLALEGKAPATAAQFRNVLKGMM